MVDTLMSLLLMAIAFVATPILIKLEISVAITGTAFGIILGNFLGMNITDHNRFQFFPGLVGVILTSPAETKSDSETMNRTCKATLGDGVFLLLPSTVPGRVVFHLSRIREMT
jgi:hypothetical protein